MTGNVLTLIAAPAAAGEIERAAERVGDALRRLGARVAGVDWLAPGGAGDIAFEDVVPDQADAAARAALDGAAIDIIAQEAAGRRKRLLVADMESTIIANEMLDELADLLGFRAEVAAITRRAMNDEIDFAAALSERVALLRGMPESALAEAGRRIRLMPGAAALVATMRHHDAHCVLVSGGFRVYTRRIAAELGFDGEVANDLVIDGGRLTGAVKEPILAREAKLETLKRVAALHRVPLAATLAVGDGANDIAMIEAAGLGVAFHATPALSARARYRVDHADLSALLYAQGYRAGEIRAG
jgi:phosphoserine phosphatase